MRNPLSETITAIPPSGIRKFFDIVSEMKDAISLGVGEPDFDTPWHIRDEGIYSLEKGRTFYTSNAGLKELKLEISRYLERRFDVGYDPDREIMVTVGGSEAIDIALRAMLDPGDEVLIPQPSYVSYVPCTILAGGVPVTVELEEKDRFRLTKEKVLEKLTPKTKILVLPFPNNPTGSILEKEDLEAVAEADLWETSLYHRGSSWDEREDCTDQWLFQILCHDWLAAGLRLRAGGDPEADAEDPPVCHHVRAHHQPVCGGGGLKKRRPGCGGDAGGL